MTFGEKLKKYRESRDMTQDELARILDTSKQVVSRYENGLRSPKINIATEFARKLNLPATYFVDDSVSDVPPSNIIPIPQMVKKPLLGKIACGKPITAVQNVEEFVSVPTDVKCDFAVRCEGDSMIDARIHDGDIVSVREQKDVENGEIAVVLIDAGESRATLKRVYKEKDQIVLMPANSAYQPLVFVRENMNQVRILGKAVAFTSWMQ